MTSCSFFPFCCLAFLTLYRLLREATRKNVFSYKCNSFLRCQLLASHSCTVLGLTRITASIGPTNSQMTIEEGSSTTSQQLEMKWILQQVNLTRSWQLLLAIYASLVFRTVALVKYSNRQCHRHYRQTWGKTRMSNWTYTITGVFTPSNDEEEPPFLGQGAEDDDQHEVEHDPLTKHPAEHSREQVVEQSSHSCASSL